MKNCKNAFPYMYFLRGHENHISILSTLYRINRFITDSNYYNYSYIYTYYLILPLFYRVFDSSKLCVFTCIFYAHFYNFSKQLFNFSAIIQHGVQTKLIKSAMTFVGGRGEGGQDNRSPADTFYDKPEGSSGFNSDEVPF